MTHIPGHVGTSGDGGGDVDLLGQLVGQIVTTQDFRSFRIESVGNTFRLIDIDTGQQMPTREMIGLVVVDQLGVGHSIGGVAQQGGGAGRTFDFRLSSRTLPESFLRAFFGDTGGGSAPSFSSTQAAQAQAEAFRQAQAQRDAAIAK